MDYKKSAEEWSNALLSKIEHLAKYYPQSFTVGGVVNNRTFRHRDIELFQNRQLGTIEVLYFKAGGNIILSCSGRKERDRLKKAYKNIEAYDWVQTLKQVVTSI